MRVNIPTALRSYTNRESAVQAEGATLADLLDDLDRRFPGLRFRIIDEQDCIRTHIKLFVSAEQVRHISTPLQPHDEVSIVMALSGGR
jgi:sulfur-carrier protein